MSTGHPRAGSSAPPSAPLGVFHDLEPPAAAGLRPLTLISLLPGRYYPELLNLLDVSATTDVSCTTIYTQFDALPLSAVLGTERASRMLQSEKDVHMFM